MDIIESIFSLLFPQIGIDIGLQLTLLFFFYLGILYLSTLRHFHHFTFGLLFIGVSVVFGVYAIIGSTPNETGTILFIVNLLVGMVFFFILDFHDFLEFVHPPSIEKEGFCAHFHACPCGCQNGYCEHSPGKWISKRATNVCSQYQRATQLRWRLF